MQKRILILVFLIAGMIRLPAQDQLNIGNAGRLSHAGGHWTLEPSFNYLSNLQAGSKFGGGLDMQLFLSPSLSMNGTVVFAPDYVHFNPGIIGIILIKSFLSGGLELGTDYFFDGEQGSGIEGCLVSAGIMLLSFESLSYHIPLGPVSGINPYFSLLRIKVPDTYFNETFVYFALGMKFHQLLGRRFFLSPYLELDRAYSRNDWWINTGVRIGYYMFR